MLKVFGVPFSAHTRKVIVGLHEKGIEHQLEPLVPLRPDLPQAFLRASPLRKIPALVDGDVELADSTVIALYLDRVHHAAPLYPTEPAAYGRALWIEELVDGALAPHVLHGLLMQRAFGPAFLGLVPDEALIASSLHEKIPPRLADLEAALDADWFAGGRFSMADITVASILLNFHYAAERLDSSRFPKLDAFFRRALARPSFVRALRAEVPVARDLKILDMTFLTELGY